MSRITNNLLCTFLSIKYIRCLLSKCFEIKRKHHYIWSYYLKIWAINKDVYYLTKKGKVAFDSVSGLACETDFYKTRSLTKQDVEFILGWSKLSPSSYLRRLHWAYLSQFVELSVVSENLASNDMGDLHLKKVIEHNSLENLHSYFESGVSDIIRELTNGNVSVLKDDDYMLKFCTYLGHQMTRTKSMKTSSINAVSSNTPPELKAYSELFERNWWFISYMLGFNIGFSFF